MPIQIDRRAADAMAQRFDEALELVRNEFASLDQPRQYRRAFPSCRPREIRGRMRAASQRSRGG